jgi:non-heme chloroperoxidase
VYFGEVQNGTLRSYPGFPHGMPTVAGTINADLLAFLQS